MIPIAPLLGAWLLFAPMADDAALLKIVPIAANDPVPVVRMPPYRMVRLRAEGAGITHATWTITPFSAAIDQETKDHGLSLFFTAPPGQYDVFCTSYVREQYVQTSWRVIIDPPGPTPTPPDPTPTPPDPKPTPPDPTPTPPKPPPSPVSGFAAIYVFESGVALKTREQYDAWFSTAAVEYLGRKAAKSGDGRPAWRRWDDDIEIVNEPDDIKALWAAAKPKLTQLPAIITSANGVLSVDPFPANEAELLKLLKSKGGE